MRIQTLLSLSDVCVWLMSRCHVFPVASCQEKSCDGDRWNINIISRFTNPFFGWLFAILITFFVAEIWQRGLTSVIDNLREPVTTTDRFAWNRAICLLTVLEIDPKGYTKRKKNWCDTDRFLTKLTSYQRWFCKKKTLVPWYKVFFTRYLLIIF